MKVTFGMAAALCGVLLMAGSAAAQAPLLQVGDSIVPIDIIPDSRSAHPAGEASVHAFDGLTNTKYLNNGIVQTGVMITPTGGASTITGLQLTTANDAPDRDPTSWTIWGTNDVINHAGLDNSDSSGFNWTQIATDAVALPADRTTLGPLQNFANATPYTSYRVVFPTVGGSTCCMQVAEIALLDAGNANVGLNTPASNVSAIQLAQPHSSSPGAEGVANILDGAANTKYLNFGKRGSGFIVTPSLASTVVQGFSITTANDAPARDPASYEIYGTNDPITTAEHATATNENWTLIAAGALDLPITGGAMNDGRGVDTGILPVTNATPYASYRVVFPTLRDAAATNSMQIADFQLFGVPEPSTSALLLVGAAMGARLRRRR